MKKIITLLACITCVPLFGGKYRKDQHKQNIHLHQDDTIRKSLRLKVQKKDDEITTLKAVIAQLSQAHHQASIENNSLKEQLAHANDLIKALGSVVLAQNPNLTE